MSDNCHIESTEGLDLSPLEDMVGDCCGVCDRLYLLRPLIRQPDGQVRIESGVAFKSCCAGSVTNDAYIRWLPHLNEAVGFVTIDVTDEHI